MPLPLILAGIGAGQSYLQNKQQQKNDYYQNMLNAEKERNSWATGQGGGQFQANSQNPYASLMSGGMTGYTQGQAQVQNNKKLDLYKQMLDSKVSSRTPQDVAMNHNPMSFAGIA